MTTGQAPVHLSVARAYRPGRGTDFCSAEEAERGTSVHPEPNRTNGFLEAGTQMGRDGEKFGLMLQPNQDVPNLHCAFFALSYVS